MVEADGLVDAVFGGRLPTQLRLEAPSATILAPVAGRN